MENAAEALKMAAFLMIFVLALSITIYSFSLARETVDTVVSIKENNKSFIKDSNGNYLNYLNFDIEDGGIRTVGVETIVDTMYRAYQENFKIYFYGVSKCGLKSFKDENGEKVYYIDLENEVFANTSETYKYLDEVLEDGFYEYLSNTQFTEKLGEYYQEDENGTSDIAEVNKNKKRVIVYTAIP